MFVWQDEACSTHRKGGVSRRGTRHGCRDDRAWRFAVSRFCASASQGKFLRVGNEIGWLGFPAVETTSLCFFGGRISAWNDTAKFYFVDGVAIHGVSGGPAFFLTHPEPMLVGVVGLCAESRHG